MPAVIIKPQPVRNPAVDAKTLNPFIVAAVTVVKENTGLSIAKDNVFVQQGKFTPAGTGIVLDVGGSLRGRIVYEFSRGVAMRIAQRMVERAIDMSTTATDLKEMLNSALLELGNQVTARAVTLIEQNGLSCNLSVPRFYLGQDLQLIHPHQKTIVLVLKTEFGPFSINIALQPA